MNHLSIHSLHYLFSKLYWKSTACQTLSNGLRIQQWTKESLLPRSLNCKEGRLKQKWFGSFCDCSVKTIRGSLLWNDWDGRLNAERVRTLHTRCSGKVSLMSVWAEIWLARGFQWKVIWQPKRQSQLMHRTKVLMSRKTSARFRLRIWGI